MEGEGNKTAWNTDDSGFPVLFGFSQRLPLFWRFQISGWLAFIVFTFPLKWVVLENFPGSVVVSAYRDGIGFFLTLGMREIYRRVYDARPSPARLAFVLAVVSMIGGAILTLLYVGFHDVLNLEEKKIFSPDMIFAIFYFRAGLCAAWSLLYFGIKFMQDSMAREVELARNETERQRLEIQMLRAQINPHFLFNALNTIIAAIGKPGQHAKELVQAFAEYLRYSLKHRDSTLVPLREELNAIESYIAVEKARYRDGLEIEGSVDPSTREILVPGVLIQPLIENAIKYGRKTSPPPLRIRFAVSRMSNEKLRMDVSNTGRWIDEAIPMEFGGIGMTNLRQRLSAIYGEKHTIKASEESGWVRVRVEIPLNP
jgi:two-component system LytT family sensor kinase